MTDSKTATDRLREMLDALNIEHFDYDKGGRTQTQWEAPDGKRHFTYETSNNPAKTARLVIAWHPTPEQAIAATLGAHSKRQSKTGDALSDDCGSLSDGTLGSGECEFELNTDMDAIRCDKCGYELPVGTSLRAMRYCGGCGRRCVYNK